MPQLTESEYKAKQKLGAGGVYVFFGEEDYLIAHYRDKCRAPYLNDVAESFNYIKITYSSPDDAELIVTSAMSAPMMSALGRKLVEINVEDFDGLGADAQEALFDAFSEAAEYEENIVILPLFSGTFDYGTLPKRPSQMYKKLLSYDGINAVCFPESTPAQLRRWIEKHFERSALFFDYDTADRMLFISGKKMTVLAQEIEKVTAYAKSHGIEKVTAKEIDAVCSSADRYDAFELSNAILEGRREDALAALAAEKTRKSDPIMLLGSIMKVVSDMLSVKVLLKGGISARDIAQKLGMHEYKAKLYIRSAEKKELSSLEDAVSACAETDAKLKSTRLGFTALERLICMLGTK